VSEPSASASELAARLARLERDKQDLARELDSGERRLRGLARAVWRVEEEERARLARELHDGIGQTLTALAMRLEGLVAEGAAEGDLTGRLGEALALAREALGETRDLAQLLRPPILDDLGLLPALSWLARSLGRADLTVDLAAEGLGPERLPAEVETLLFRVVQEALNNVVKHAGASRAEVRLLRCTGWLVLTIVDSGRGFEPQVALGGAGAGAGFGLRGMRDRVECSDGRFALRSAPGRGTVVEVAVPLAEPTGGPP